MFPWGINWIWWLCSVSECNGWKTTPGKVIIANISCLCYSTTIVFHSQVSERVSFTEITGCCSPGLLLINVPYNASWSSVGAPRNEGAAGVIFTCLPRIVVKSWSTVQASSPWVLEQGWDGVAREEKTAQTHNLCYGVIRRTSHTEYDQNFDFSGGKYLTWHFSQSRCLSFEGLLCSAGLRVKFNHGSHKYSFFDWLGASLGSCRY